MTFSEFKVSLHDSKPPSDLDVLLQALWHDGKGEWEKAHQAAQEIDTDDGAWVHAYLHRKEGDQSNALYWYQRAKQPTPKISLEDEWAEIVKKLIH